MGFPGFSSHTEYLWCSYSDSQLRAYENVHEKYCAPKAFSYALLLLVLGANFPNFVHESGRLPLIQQSTKRGLLRSIQGVNKVAANRNLRLAL
jgi:hypothetical protein